jgi:hypothetical protein
MFTFETQYPAPSKGEWRRSGQRLDTLEEAIAEMNSWVYACAINDLMVSVRLVRLDND